MSTEDINEKLDQIKDRVLNRVIFIVLFVQILGLYISIKRMMQTGFHWIYGVHIFLVIVVFLLNIFRNKMPIKMKGTIFMMCLYTLAIGGLASFGLQGFGYVYFIPATAIAFLYYNRKIGWILTSLSLLLILLIAYLFSINVLSFSPDSTTYMLSKGMWLNMVITLCLVSIVITLFWSNLFDLLMSNLTKVYEQQDHMQKMNEELLIAKDKAEESDRLKSSFLANISHEIRTPLNAIIGFSQMIVFSDTEEERVDLFETVKENNNIMLKLIGDIVDFSKVESNSLTVVFSEFDVQKVVESVEKMLNSNIKENVVFNVQKTSFIINSDKECLLKILHNIVHNALKFTEKGAVMVKYSYDGDNLNFEIIDTGIGIGEEHIDKIFERFYQVDSFNQGAGLGLTLSKAIIEKLGGQLTVESEIGKGSTFKFSIKNSQS